MDLADLKRLVDAFEASDWNEIHLEVDGVEVHLSAVRGNSGQSDDFRARPEAHTATSVTAPVAPSVAAVPSAAVPPAASAAPAASATSAAAAPAASAPAASAPAASASLAAGDGAAGVTGTPFATLGSAIGAVPAADGAGGEPVLAPSPGIFWRSPAPGQPPFVEVGSRVEPSSVVCIVELMKLMNRISAGCSGVVTAIPVGNGTPVEKGEPIVYVRPDPT